MSETLRQAAMRQFGFNPGEKRGPDGKWIKGGAAAKGVLKKVTGETGLRRQEKAAKKKRAAAVERRLDNPDRF